MAMKEAGMSSLFQRVEQVVDERLQREATRLDEVVAEAMGRACWLLRVQVEALQREVSRLRSGCGSDDRDSARPTLSSVATIPSLSGCCGVAAAREELSTSLAATLEALGRRQEITSAGVSELRGWMERLEESHLQLRMQDVETVIFACEASGFTCEERHASVLAFRKEAMALQERLRAAGRKMAETPLSSIRLSTGSTGMPTESSTSGGRSPVASGSVATVTSGSVATALDAPLSMSRMERPGLLEVPSPTLTARP